jgi:hypothetical protein
LSVAVDAVLPMTGIDRRLAMSRPLPVAALLLTKLQVRGTRNPHGAAAA